MAEANQSYLPKIPTARKGDLVALETTRTIHFVNPYRSETSSEWTLVRVASATRDGIVKGIETKWGYVQKLAHMCGRPRVHTLGDKQEQAERLLASCADDQNFWTSKDELRAAILAAGAVS
jgi:hypothetical protein